MNILPHIYHALNQDLSDKVSTSIFQGGTRSGKTYNIIAWIIFVYCVQNKGKSVSIFRAALTSCKSSVLQDFLTILKNENLYNSKNFKGGTKETPYPHYELWGNTIYFMGADNFEKLKSISYDLVFFCELTGTTYQNWVQIAIRAKGMKIVDFNPSISDDHWIVTELQSDSENRTHLSTYLQNYQNLSNIQIKEIEKLCKNPTLWKIYGLGQRAIAEGLVFPNAQLCEALPGIYDWRSFGLDHGDAQDPRVLVEVRGVGEDDIYIHEHFYRTHLRLNEIIDLMKKVPNIYDFATYGDHQVLTNGELQRAGLPVIPAWKPPGSVEEGVKYLQSKNIFITRSSVNMWRERNNYCYPEDKNGKLKNVPIDAFNHGWDATRYAVMSNIRKKGSTGVG